MNNKHHNQSGTVLMYAVIILSIGSTMALAILSTAGIDAFVDANTQGNSHEIREDLLGCKDELLIQHRIDENYSPSQIDIGDAVCDLSISSPASDTREAVLTRSQDGITRGLKVEFEVDPVVVTNVVDSYN